MKILKAQEREVKARHRVLENRPGVARSPMVRNVLPGNLEEQRKQADKTKGSNLALLVSAKSQSKKTHIVPVISYEA